MIVAAIFLVGSLLFISTVGIILLHLVEWSSLGTVRHLHPTDTLARNPLSSKAVILQTGLGIETVYYFLLLTAFVVFFPGNMTFSTLIAVLGPFHLAAFWATMGKSFENQIRKLTTTRVASILVLDILEVFFLIALAFQLHPLFVCFFACS